MKRKELLFVQFERWGWDEKSWSKRTRTNYAYRARNADAWLEEKFGTPLTFAKTDQLRPYLFSRTPHPRNRNHIRQSLVGYFDFTIAMELRKDNPAKALPVLKEPRSIPKALTAEQISRIIRCARLFGPMVDAMVKTFAFTGMRKSEVRLMEWRFLDADPGWIAFMAKGNKERRLFLHEIVEVALRKQRMVCQDPTWVFPSSQRPGRPVSEQQVHRLIRQVGNMAGVEGLHPHLFRHSFATQLLDQGTDLRTLQEVLGHESLSTTAGYLKVRPANVKSTMAGTDYERGDLHESEGS